MLLLNISTVQHLNSIIPVYRLTGHCDHPAQHSSRQGLEDSFGTSFSSRSVGTWAWRHPRRQTQSPCGGGVAPKLCQVTRGSKSLVAPGLEKVETPSASGQQSNPSPLKTEQADGGLDKRNP